MTLRRTRPFVPLLFVTLAAALAPNVASAQERSATDVAQARDLFNQGLALRKKGDAAGALERLRAAHALVHTPITGVELGRTYSTLGKIVEARETFLSIGRIPVAAEETARSAAARSESTKLAEQLRPRIPTLAIHVTGVPPETLSLTIDGATIPAEAIASPRPVDPGSHTVVAKSSAGGSAETVVEANEGETKNVDLQITPPPPAPQAGPSTVANAATGAPPLSAESSVEPSPAPHGALGWSLLAGGAAVLAAGAVVMIVESGKAADANSRHDENAYNGAATGWRVGLIASIAGAAAAAGGTIVLATSPRTSGATGSRATVWVGLDSRDLHVGGNW